jgi:hypothetical protein
MGVDTGWSDKLAYLLQQSKSGIDQTNDIRVSHESLWAGNVSYYGENTCVEYIERKPVWIRDNDNQVGNEREEGPGETEAVSHRANKNGLVIPVQNEASTNLSHLALEVRPNDFH